MASINTSKTLSSTSNPHSYDVFLSFRGKDTRNNFTDHLHANLVAHGIHTFRDDDELEKGGDIASDLERAIQESKIFIIIFSKNYATSKWCLNELVKIIECKTIKGSVVLPVFYHVEPRVVGNQEGSFRKAFLEHEKDADEEKEKTIKTWKEALKTAAKLSGYPLAVDNQSEAKLIQKIHADILTILERKPLYVGDNIVGMEFHLEQLKSRIKTELDEVRMVGIYGTGGIGKTTIAMAIYNDISSQFDGSSFLRNVGAKCEDGLLKLQKTLLQNILKGEKPKFSDTSEGINVIKDRLQSKRVLIVLDDVNNKEQLEHFAGKYGWYGAKSVIIITTRDQHLLVEFEVDADYEVQKLKHEKSTELFNWCAFKQSTPKPGFESLSNSVVRYADGLPIALRVLGYFLVGMTPKEWENELQKLEKIPDRKVQSVLQVSYDKLDSQQQSIFLDIACFFRGKDKDFVSRILGRGAAIDIKVLKNRCLITISENNKLDMHDLLQQMGQEIIRLECPEEPSKRSRLWDPSDVNSVFSNNTGTKAIQGLSIQIFQSSQTQFTTESFKRMNRLRLLKIDQWTFSDWYGHSIPMDLEFPSSELTYLQFSRYPLESLPANFCGKKLVELDLSCSRVKQLWKGNKILGDLKVINLSYSENLVEIPDLLSMPNLEILILAGCTSLVSLPESICNLSSLETLDMTNCSNLRSFPKIKDDMENLKRLDLGFTSIEELPSSIGHLKALQDLNLLGCQNLVSLPESICNLSSLETLNMSGCSNLKSFPEIKDDMENLKRLDLGFTSIEELPSSIGHLKALQDLNLLGCQNLVSLPESICNLSSLETLSMSSCSNLKSFPEIKDDMENLKTLDLGFTSIEELPSSIGHLKALQDLNLSYCQNLVSLPESICNLSSLQTLYMSSCSNLKSFPEIKDDMENLKRLHLGSISIEELPSSIGHLKALQDLNLSGCQNLVSLPKSFCNLSSLETLDMRICSNLKSFPEIKDDMENLKTLDLGFTSIEELPSSIGHLKALQDLNLLGCQNLMSLPESICNLSSLETLNMSGCSNLKSFPEIKDDMENLKRLDLGSTSIEELPSSIGHLKALQDLNLSDCQNLVSLPESICNLSSLETLDMSNCSNLKSFPEIKDDMENLKRLDLGSTSIEELPSSIGHLKALQDLNLSYCQNLVSLPESICNLSSLKTLHMSGCSNLKSFPEMKDDMKNLKRLYLDFTSIEELPSSIGHLKALQDLNLLGCQNLVSLPESICNLSSLETLNMSSCSNLKSFPEIKDDMENLKRLDLGSASIEELPSSIGHLKALQNLNLSGCQNLVSLPESICNLSSLETLNMRSCSNLKSFPEIKDDMENLKRLDLGSTSIEELPSLIGHLKALQYLNLSDCQNLVSLPESICNLSSLKTLNMRSCSNLKSFPKIKDDMENLKRLDFGSTSIEELPSLIGHLKALQYLNLSDCQNLVSLPESICNLSSLKTLSVSSCPKLERLEVKELIGCWGSSSLTCCILKEGVIWSNNCFSSLKTLNLQCNQREAEVLNHHIFLLSSLLKLSRRNSINSKDFLRAKSHSLEVLSVASFNPMARGILSDRRLTRLSIDNCNLMEEGIPTNSWNQPSLVNLSLCNCSLTEGDIINHICLLPSLQSLSLDGNHFRSIPASIIQLSYLRALNLSHCQKLLQIPELPPSLRFLDVHDCPCLETSSSPSSLLGFSLFKCFNSAIEESNRRPEITVIIPGNKGIPEWISQQKEGSRISKKLPMNWYQNDDLLGFALYSVFDLLHVKSGENLCSFTCELSFHDHQFRSIVGKLSFEHRYSCCHSGGESNRVWVTYYPKLAIEDKYCSNKWRHLEASFSGYFGRNRVKVKECGFHLVFMPHILNTDSNTHAESSFGTNHWPRLWRENNYFNVKRSRDDAEDHPKEDPHPKRLRHL